MLGVLISLVFAFGMAGLARKLFGRWLDDLDPAARVGLSGLLGLGVAGWITLPIGLLPSGLRWGVWPIGLLAVSGAWFGLRAMRTGEWRFVRPASWRLAMLVAALLALAFGLVGTLGPVDSFEWDALAYHLAVPKLWIEAGQITLIPTIHHSNFPFAVDNLYIWGLLWGDSAGAKTFSLLYGGFGALALFGLARARYGERAGWWAVVAFLGIPAVLWEIGTAYIDVSHGLWAGLGILFAAEVVEDPTKRGRLWLSAVCLGMAAASKYTGLQVAIAAALVVAIASVVQKRFAHGIGQAALLGSVALLLCSPWLARNFVQLGNPVYPFFYESFQGKNWGPSHAEIYKNEQQTFGVGRTPRGRNWNEFPSAVIGLAYQPGRYTNPNPVEGQGFPTGAMGVTGIAAGLLWLVAGRPRRFEGAVLGAVFLCFLMWFALSQQSRYALNMTIPLCLLAGGAVARLRAGPILAALASAQGMYSLWLIKGVTVDPKLPVIVGKVSNEDYLLAVVPFYEAAQTINEDTSARKVVLYDEVFGYYLNTPYLWGNPGHSAVFDYEAMPDGNGLVAALRSQGVTHLYVSFVQEPAGLLGRLFNPRVERRGLPLEDSDLIRNTLNDWQRRWKALILDAYQKDLLMPMWSTPAGVYFEIIQG